ncbi:MULTISPECIES: ATP-binding cassette domain-containing protein, partial [unclassified Mesorhizobium]
TLLANTLSQGPISDTVAHNMARNGLLQAARCNADLRLQVQSAILTVGAYLVVRQEATAGVMIVSSIMMGRALAPVDLAISSWKPFLIARQSWARLEDLLEKVPETAPVVPMPAPERELRLESVTIVPPGESKPTVTGLAFAIQAGSALGVIGASGSGKSTLSRAIVGAWTPVAGKVRIDSASLDQWD